jgi:hypothetical protein
LRDPPKQGKQLNTVTLMAEKVISLLKSLCFATIKFGCGEVMFASTKENNTGIKEGFEVGPDMVEENVFVCKKEDCEELLLIDELVGFLINRKRVFMCCRFYFWIELLKMIDKIFVIGHKTVILEFQKYDKRRIIGLLLAISNANRDCIVWIYLRSFVFDDELLGKGGGYEVRTDINDQC